jgi:hypothetical protein
MEDPDRYVLLPDSRTPPSTSDESWRLTKIPKPKPDRRWIWLVLIWLGYALIYGLLGCIGPLTRPVCPPSK